MALPNKIAQFIKMIHDIHTMMFPEKLRKRILEIAHSGSSVHVGCAFSIVEIICTLFSKVLKFDPSKGPDQADRDYLILSKGHGVMTLYVAHEALGWIQTKDLNQYFKDGSLFHGLVEAKTPGMEVCSGSLGHGLPIAVGMALGLKRKKSQRRVFVIVGDGEMNEGTMWEALLFAGHHQLDNLTVIVDANGFQAMGKIQEVLNMEPFTAKFQSFGWDAVECDGHSLGQLEQVLRIQSDRPRAVIARTQKGKGVSFMENNNEWHYRRLTPELLQKALVEVEGMNTNA